MIPDPETGALILLAHVRQALGDDGRRMQDELIEHCRTMAAWTAAVKLKQARGRHHTQLAAETLYALLP